jgi:hypothetical protein
MNLKVAATGFVAGWIALAPAQALITEHGTEPVHLSSSSEAVDKLINHPARFQGRVGPLGPQAEFLYHGTPEVLNGVLTQYAAIPGRSSILYLTRAPMAGPLAVHSELNGTVSIWIRAASVEDLKFWKIPPGLGVERIKSTGGLLQEPRSDLEKAIGKFLRSHPVPAGAKESPANRRF